MSAHATETARILREQFNRTKRDAEFLAGGLEHGHTPRTDRDARELALAQEQAMRNLAEREKQS